MVDIKIAVVSVVVVLSIFLQTGIRAQRTNGTSSEDDSCLLLEEELEFQRVINRRLRNILKNKQQKINNRLENKRRRMTTVTTLENELTTIETPQTERPWPTLGPVTAIFTASFNYTGASHGFTKVEGSIYALYYHHNGLSIIKVFEDLIGYRFMRDIALSAAVMPEDIVYSNESKCVYISDYYRACIWVMTTTGEHRLTKWLNNVTWPYTLSLSNEGHLLVLRQSEPFSQLEIYALNATLIRRLQLPQDIKNPRHVVQTSSGNFIIPHWLNNASILNDGSSGLYVISQLTNEGQLINRFIPRNREEELHDPRHLSLDSDNNRLFVANSNYFRVNLFDSNLLTWSQILVSPEMSRYTNPERLLYDASKKHLFVALHRGNATVYEIN